ncbi:hypothetical protein PC9H_004517 [Pleurotus ostreatus]|uniref:Uncharacterized protein n=1 Tax=Pleurotus ostreatus TaxID=5322 RepID=A0A8H7DS24_PLEOS|nr:uncharacterized protein PC9H_004517 [Pleurotus ostreatus]KAF7432576.1 hypothetical protein PC9H_004517 [Pleurotus ostreatus]
MAAAAKFYETVQPEWPSPRVSVLVQYTATILEDDCFEEYYPRFKHEAKGLLDDVVNLCRSRRKPDITKLARVCDDAQIRLESLLEPLGTDLRKDFQADYATAVAEDASTEGWSPLSLFSKSSRKELGGKFKNVRTIHCAKGSLDDESDWENSFADYYALDPVFLVLWQSMLLRSVKVHLNPRIYGYSKTSGKWMQLSFRQTIQNVGAGPFYILCDRQLPITFGGQLYGNIFQQQNGQSQYLLKRPSGQLVRVYAPSVGNVTAKWNKDSKTSVLPDYVPVFPSILHEVDKSWTVEHTDISGLIPEDDRFQETSKPSKVFEPIRMHEPNQGRKDTLSTLCDSSLAPDPNDMPVPTLRPPPTRVGTDDTLVDAAILPIIRLNQKHTERAMPPHISIPLRKDISKFSPSTPVSTPLLTPQSALAGMMMSAVNLAAVGGGRGLPMHTPVSPESAGKKVF